ncbi:hypothetical protein BABINDRAFT_147878 [Babjeviella inositovora NRRL Y-12698]|uniref:Uncharacterized protein n=1 Tax=Babjeviella inositovora NRRL Y-12698 TaxID=984486 RepID=A0A1E3QN13_9ASCO|nr:uncharacterized protein BABINDRAFT_147878 [Babjeviella inositovora NRRL Y-12698]ODQ79089.1 hypothetical protein BABINDRAFT_147878 [Babjeviella inositovora NRRL Y-12698]
MKRPAKCSRCRVNRDEPVLNLRCYATCRRCREVRKKIKTPLPVYREFDKFCRKVQQNTEVDLLDQRLATLGSPSHIQKCVLDEITAETYLMISNRLIQVFVVPLMEATGYRFVVRDHRQGGVKKRKISLEFVCSQDKAQKRVSHALGSAKELKVENCQSKLTLVYDLLTMELGMNFNHRSHTPYQWKRGGMAKAGVFRNTKLDHDFPSGKFECIRFIQETAPTFRRKLLRGTSQEKSI